MENRNQEKSIKRFKLDPSNPPTLTPEQQSRLDALTDSDIDYSDIPDLTTTQREAIDALYRPIKQMVTIRLDADVVAWLKKKHGKYQTAVNQILRQYMNDNL